jgi:rod shape-determining protein MreC
LLLTDHASAISATIQRSQARGVLKGKGGTSCSLEFTVREDDVKVGDIVATSGTGGVFQKGLPLGEVTMVRKAEYGMFQTIDVKPAVNTLHLDEVLVVVRKGEP